MQNSPRVCRALGAVEAGRDFLFASAGTRLGLWTAQLGSARAGVLGHIAGHRRVARSGLWQQMEKVEMNARIKEREAGSTSQARLPAAWRLAQGQGWHGGGVQEAGSPSAPRGRPYNARLPPASPPGAYLPISDGKVTTRAASGSRCLLFNRETNSAAPPPQPLLY